MKQKSGSVLKIPQGLIISALFLSVCQPVSSAAPQNKLSSYFQAIEASDMSNGRETQQRILQIRAVLSSDGNSLRHKHPLKWVQRSSLPRREINTGGSLRLKISFDHSEALEFLFDAYEESDSTFDEKLFGGFTLEIPLKCDQLPLLVEVENIDGRLLIEWSENEMPTK